MRYALRIDTTARRQAMLSAAAISIILALCCEARGGSVDEAPELTRAVQSGLPDHWSVTLTIRTSMNGWWREGGMVRMNLSQRPASGDSYVPKHGPNALLYFISKDYDPTDTNRCLRVVRYPLVARTSDYQVFLFGQPSSWGWTNAPIDIAAALVQIDGSVESTGLTDEELRRYDEATDEKGQKHLTNEKAIEMWKGQTNRLKQISAREVDSP